MKPILDRLAEGDVLIGDGAMGTFLQARGLTPGECPELWCVERAADVREVHRRYLDAGSDFAECNSFGANRFKLKHYGLEDRARELNRAAAAIARDVAGDSQYVLGSMGPTGEFLEPLGDVSEAAMLSAFRDQACALEDGGAHAVIVETMSALEEARLGVRAAKEKTSLTVMASFTFQRQAHGGYATMMGVTPERFAAAMIEAEADVLGTNCGTGPDDMIEIVKIIRKVAPRTPIIAMPNAGMPVLEGGRTVFKETPSEMARKAPLLVRAGANIVGGCCGTGPDHIAAMRAALAPC
jgi:5-methyltetrahydrofolate--homocysteine methyltransferase